MNWFPTLIMCSCIGWWIYQCGRIVLNIPNLIEIQSFVNNTLEINEVDLKTMLWNDVVSKIILSKEEVEDGHPAAKLDAHTIANRIMRKENYLIALFNKNILDLTLPLVGKRTWMTRLVQDYLAYSMFSFVFDSRGKFRKRFLKESNKYSKFNLGINWPKN